ncbi:hypothetical protein LAT59_03900 [Candidatus Gracilibacteria bacterium]|nr:hypothetical protein [Candidatus Gracilibacteria bacterium]
MKKDIRDFHNETCFIDIPESFYHEENLLEDMIQSVIGDTATYQKMKKLFHKKSVSCIKKTYQNQISQEYYLWQSYTPIKEVFHVLNYTPYVNLEALVFPGMSLEFSANDIEINIFDNNSAYIVGQEEVIRKNVYYYFSHYDEQSIKENMKNTIYPFTQKDIDFLVSWLKYQRDDGVVLVGKKKKADTIYFTRINFLGFLKFIKEFGWEKYIGNFVFKNSSFLKYYVFDIALEYVHDGHTMKVTKTSIYGLT